MIPSPQPGAGERDVLCDHAGDCLDQAARQGWSAFNCGECPIRGLEQRSTREAIAEQATTGGVPALAEEWIPGGGGGSGATGRPTPPAGTSLNPPPAPTPPASRRELVAQAARRLPPDDTPPRRRPSPPAKEKPMPATTALERARALRAQQEQLVKELQVELADLEGRAAEIRETLAELGAETTAAKVVRNGGRKATARAQKPRATTKGKGSLADRVLVLIRQGKGTSADLVAATGKPQGSVGAALVALQKRGQVKRVGRGRYEALA
jgi:hypothetical protein